MANLVSALAAFVLWLIRRAAILGSFWALIALLGMFVRHPDSGPTLSKGQTVRFLLSGSANSLNQGQFAKASVKRLFSEYPESQPPEQPALYVIILIEPKLPVAGGSLRQEGNCIIALNPNHHSFHPVLTPGHEFNHCRRGDIDVPPTFTGYVYYEFVEVFPMELELRWRRLSLLFSITTGVHK